MAGDGASLRAAGTPVELAGQQRRLVLDMEGLCVLEELFPAGMGPWLRAVQQEKWGPRRMQALRAGLLAGLTHYASLPAGDPQYLPEPLAREMLQGVRIPDYPKLADAVISAFGEAMDSPKASAAKETHGAGTNSPGESVTTLPPSPSAAATGSSGA